MDTATTVSLRFPKKKNEPQTPDESFAVKDLSLNVREQLVKRC